MTTIQVDLGFLIYCVTLLNSKLILYAVKNSAFVLSNVMNATSPKGNLVHPTYQVVCNEEQ